MTRGASPRIIPLRQRVIFAGLVICSLVATGLVFAQRKGDGLAATIWELARKSRFYVAYKLESKSEPHFSFSYDVISEGKSGQPRVYLFHGLRSDWTYWKLSPHDELISSLRPLGLQMIATELPYASASFFEDNGRSYCSALFNWFSALRGDVVAKLGIREDILVGESWGGFHSLLLAGAFPVSGYIAIHPVVDVSKLSEFWMISNRGCSPFAVSEVLSGKPGLIVWGNKDFRVDYKDTVNLVSSMSHFQPNKTSTIIEKGAAHGYTSGTYESVATWISSTFGRGTGR